jgi:hypothetical protein
MSMLDRSGRPLAHGGGVSPNSNRALEVVSRVGAAIPEAREPFWRVFMDCARTKDAGAARTAVALIALYAHLGPFTRQVVSVIDRRLAALDSETTPPLWAADAPLANAPS